MEQGLDFANKNLAIRPDFVGQRKLCYEKVDNSDLSEEVKILVKKLFEQTVYISWDETIDLLDQALTTALLDIPDNFYIFVENGKFGSGLLFLCVFWHRVKERCLGVIELKDLPQGPQNVLFIDDFALTGCSIAREIDQYTYDTQRTDIKSWVVLAATTNQAIDTISEFGAKVYSTKKFEWTEVDPMIDSNDEGTSKTLFYSDHKISNIFSNLPDLYHYGKISDQTIGCLITHPPYEEIKTLVWETYFSHLTKRPTLFNYY